MGKRRITTGRVQRNIKIKCKRNARYVFLSLITKLKLNFTKNECNLQFDCRIVKLNAISNAFRCTHQLKRRKRSKITVNHKIDFKTISQIGRQNGSFGERGKSSILNFGL